MIIGKSDKKHHIEIDGIKIEQVVKFKCMGGVLNSEGNLDDINEIKKQDKLYYTIKIEFLSKREVPKEMKAEVIRRE